MADTATGARALERPSDLMALLAEVEAEHPVDRWSVGDLAVWPLVRTRLAHRLARSLDGRPQPPEVAGWADGARRAAGAIRGVARVAGRPRPGPRVDDDAGAYALLCGDGISFAEGADGPVDRHLDPLRSCLAPLGVGGTLLETGHAAPHGLRPPVVHVQPALDARMARARCAHRAPAVLEDLDGVRTTLGRWGAARHLPDARSIALFAAVTDAMADTFEHWIERRDATLGIVVEWYAVAGMAFTVACRRAGVPVVDVQHGVQGPQHYAYAGWSHAGPAGTDLLPDRFWVWSEDEVDAIASWAPEGRRRCLVGGNLERNRWTAGESGGPEAVRHRDAVQAWAPSGAPLVVVALSDDEPEAVTDEVLSVVAAAPTAWRWGFRCHPTDPDVARWSGAAALRGLGAVEVDRSTNVPLFPLLGRADAVMTRFSSVALDAAALGVPVVLTDPIGVELYPELLADGRAVFAEPGQEVATLTELLGRRRTTPRAADADAALHELVALAGGVR